MIVQRLGGWSSTLPAECVLRDLLMFCTMAGRELDPDDTHLLLLALLHGDTFA